MSDIVNVFDGDAFSNTSLSTSQNGKPPFNALITSQGWFQEVPIATTIAVIEYNNEKLGLIPATPRGGAGTKGDRGKRKAVNVSVPHFEVVDTLFWNDIVGVRKFGSTDTISGAQEVLGPMLLNQRRELEASIEYGLLGAVLGSTIYPAGSTYADIDWFTTMGVTQTSVDMQLDHSDTKIVSGKCGDIIHAIQDAAMGIPVTRVAALVDRLMFASLIGHADVNSYNAAFNPMFSPAKMENPIAARYVNVGGITFYEYYNNVGGDLFLEENSGIAFPADPGFFVSAVAPGDIKEAVGTIGQRFYVDQREVKKGVEFSTQSNVLSYPVVPATLIALTTAHS